jgi:3-deoxy-manno-octulosonate cytidylyltransferase (CMP-KDO synthetase)
MIHGKKIVCVIPARLKSTRFKEKVLKSLGGKPILLHVLENAKACNCFDDIVFAIDHEKTKALIDSFGGKWFMTDESCPSGTMRLCEYRIQSKVKADLWLNWQADEPLIPKEMIQDLLLSVDFLSDVYTLKKKISNEEATKATIVKVVTNKQDQALYFSRAMIPFIREEKEKLTPYYKHIGLYLYTDEALEQISNFNLTNLEQTEKLEQLTFLYHGMKIKAVETTYEGIGIDLEEDLARAENLLKALS